MKTKISFVLAVYAFFSCLILSCGTMSKAGVKITDFTESKKQDFSNAASATGKAIKNAAEQISPEQEYYIGRAVAANILSSYKIYNGNPALTSYLNNICAAITINSPRPDVYNGYHVAILDTSEINAFATSGGHIFVTRGLISAAKSEDALAGAIAHEVAHIQLQHSIKAIKTSRITQAIIVTGASAVGAVTGKDIDHLTDVFNESVGEIFQTVVNNGYSQTQEFDADRTALSLLASAGYSPSGLIDMLGELKDIQGKTSGGFNKTHPTPVQRIVNVEKSISKYKVADTRSYRQTRFSSSVKIV
jgi:predicted Zn-dependent protease